MNIREIRLYLENVKNGHIFSCNMLLNVSEVFNCMNGMNDLEEVRFSSTVYDYD